MTYDNTRAPAFSDNPQIQRSNGKHHPQSQQLEGMITPLLQKFATKFERFTARDIEELDNYIRSNPVKSVVLATMAGIMLSKVARRR